MKRALFLLGLCSALLLSAGAWADLPGVSREARQRMYEERMRAEADAAIASVMVQGTPGGVQLVFEIAGPGTCEYTLRGPKSEDDPGPVVAKGSFTATGAGRQVVKKGAIVPAIKENGKSRYHFEALCRVTPVEQTNFGAKETGEVKEVRIERFFGLQRENCYRVTI